ncbi:glycosyltransferase [Neiella marina]|uniref:Glycosyltransferase n=1 Tax=Neiella holothuriorum TaxID=2870530 RepID=A0ABS7ECJ1_9GAMM|nr:MJ1255/VC2487 family glycosyltransferase [Neiella holothuriorum]MBW8190056.1 glycosyltransferase [Neiella holothuriorum]
MRILYGVQATGNGHITRARAMAQALSKTDLNVDYLFTGRPREQLFNMELFGDFQTRSGLSFATDKGRVNLLKTFQQAQLKQLYKDIQQLDLSQYDLILNDFEPVSAWAAKRQHKRSIGISHQAAFSYPVPKTGQDLGSKMVMRYFAPTAEQLGVHWHHFGQPILPPIIDVDLQQTTPVANKIVVYLPFEDLSVIKKLLAPFTEHHFFVYHPDAVDSEEEHLSLRALSRTTFEHDLLQAEGVIANGGFELPSEALFLGKKILVKPLVRQFEQESNVMTLHQLGLAASMSRLDDKKVADWLQAPAAQPINYPNVAQCLSRWLANGARQPLHELSSQLWAAVQFPSYARLPSKASAS